MASVPTTVEALSGELRRLSASGVLGFYNCCEVTEIVGFGPVVSPFNVFSIVVFEECFEQEERPRFLNSKKRIKIPQLRGYTFGVYRYHVKTESLRDQVTDLARSTEWKLGGENLHLCPLVPTRPQFIPPDATEAVTLNRLLKNNFWNGSYILELFDNEKRYVQPLLEKPPRLHELSEAIQQFVPLRLASVTDRLGNIIIQLPVRVLMSDFHFTNDVGMRVSLAWDKRAQPRPCRVLSVMEFDGAIAGFGTSLAKEGASDIHTGDSTGLNRCIAWDDEKNLILAASAPVSFIAQVNLNIGIANPEPRIIVIANNGSFSLQMGNPALL